MPSAWYLIHAKPKQEKTAQLNLERQGYTVYLPLHRQQRRRAAQYQSIIEPLFPRYLFIFLDAETDNWGPIRSTRGVAELVRFGGQPAKVPVEMIEYLKEQETERLEENKAPVLEEGDTVEITEGVMASYHGIFKEKVGSKRASILLSVADHYTTVQVPTKSLIKRE